MFLRSINSLTLMSISWKNKTIFMIAIIRSWVMQIKVLYNILRFNLFQLYVCFSWRILGKKLQFGHFFTGKHLFILYPVTIKVFLLWALLTEFSVHAFGDVSDSTSAMLFRFGQSELLTFPGYSNPFKIEYLTQLRSLRESNPAYFLLQQIRDHGRR